MAVKYVIPYQTKGKNDLNNALAIYEVVQRQSTRFVAEQQAILFVHRVGWSVFAAFSFNKTMTTVMCLADNLLNVNKLSVIK